MKDLKTIKEVLSGHAQGFSLEKIHKITGVPKTTVKRIIDRCIATGQTAEAIVQMSDEASEKLIMPSRRASMNYLEPDWESVYLAHERPRKSLQLRVCWERYLAQSAASGKKMSYSTFCRAYENYKNNLPASMRDVSMAFEWEPGKVAMIDYSGDCLHYTDPNGTIHKAEIFVGVMPYSNFIFCMATKDQTRSSWLLGCKAMLEYFGAVPDCVLLDNSTSLVVKADKYDPKYCAEFRGFASYYGFSPLAVRPAKPRDKAAGEAAVGLVQRRITNELSSSQFLSLADVNSAIKPLLEELNDIPLSEKSGTRRERFQEEKPVMQALPVIAYELGLQEKILKVRSDYQIRMHNRRFSVPYTYAGKKVKVRLLQQKNLLVVYDLQTGKEIARHHYDGTGKVLNVQPEHMPINHLMQLRTKEDLLGHLKVVGRCAYELGERITRNQPELVARKILSGMLAVARNAGNDLAEEVAQAVIKRPEPTFETYRKEVDRCIGNDTQDVPLGRGVSLTVSKSQKNVRGADYYAKLLEQKQDAAEKASKPTNDQGE